MHLIEFPALQAGLGKLLGLWPEIRRTVQHQKALAAVGFW
jgi:hypothetical protein